MVEQELITDRIQKGLAISLEDRQARWDRFTAWSANHSLSEILDLEDEYQRERAALGLPTQERLSRERVRAILARARPGTVGRPKLPGLMAKQETLQKRLARWKKVEGEKAADTRAALTAELEQVKAAIKAEKKAKR